MNKISLKTKNIYAVIIIFLITCFLSINTYIILQKNQYYNYCLNEDVLCGVDITSNLNYLCSLSSSIKNLDFNTTFYLLKYCWKPQVLFIYSLPFTIILNKINLFITIINFFIIFFSLFFIYKIVSKLHSVEAGVFSSFIFAFIPCSFLMHRSFFIEPFLTTIYIGICLYIIYASKFYKYSFYLNLTLLLIIALLTKETMFVLLPTIIFFILLNKNINIDKKTILNLCIVFSVSILISYMLWYYNNTPNIVSHILEKSKINRPDENYFFYIKNLYNFSLSPILFLTFIISCIYFVLKRKFLVLILSFIYFLFISSFASSRYLRHIFPIIWIIPIIVSLFIFEIKNKSYRYIAIILISSILIIQFFLMNYMPIEYYYNHKSSYKCNEFKGINFYNYKPIKQTALQQYNYFFKLLGSDFTKNTCFINVPLVTAYNIFLLQKKQDIPLCKSYWYQENNDALIFFENVVVNDGYKELFYNTNKFLTEHNFIPIKNLDIDISDFHNAGKPILYKNKKTKNS